MVNSRIRNTSCYFSNPKIPLKPAPTLHPKTMTVQLLYHHVFFIWQLIPPSRTLPASPAVAFSAKVRLRPPFSIAVVFNGGYSFFSEGDSEGGIPKNLGLMFFEILLCEPCARAYSHPRATTMSLKGAVIFPLPHLRLMTDDS